MNEVVPITAITRDFIMDFERELARLPQVEFQVRHHFAPGMYMRELFIPAGVCLTGMIHRHAHLNVLAQGDIAVLTEDGVKRLRGPLVLKSEAGIKRVGFAFTDTTWITCHLNPDNETDIEKLEARYVTNDYKQLETETPCLSQQ